MNEYKLESVTDYGAVLDRGLVIGISPLTAVLSYYQELPELEQEIVEAIYVTGDNVSKKYTISRNGHTIKTA